MSNEERDSKCFRAGKDDGLIPVESLDLSRVNDFDELLQGMESTAFGGRSLGEGRRTLLKMVEDKDAFVGMTISGAMTIAKQGLIVCDMIDHGFIQAIVSTGALMTHGLVEASGMTHFKYDPRMDDNELYRRGYARVYDTLELENNLDDLETIVSEVLSCYVDSTIKLSSRKMCWLLGMWLDDNTKGRSILKSAYRMNVPVYIPAFTDSELGLDVGIYSRNRVQKGYDPINFNPFIDLDHCTELVNRQKRIGIFTIGGGVPRNWFQQVACNLDLISRRMDKGSASKHINPKRIHYALRICPEPVHWGGLSGCTYSEGVSWGKFIPVEEGGMHTEILCDATIAWPILIKAAIQNLEKRGIKVEKNFDLKEELNEVAKIMRRIGLER